MTKLNIELKNCYGIKDLKHKFEFTDIHKTFSIYASNGSMKTSFAKTFEDISKNKNPKDLVFPNRKTTYSIKLNDKDMEPSQIFVINSYKKEYESTKISTLLVNKKLKKEYEEVYKNIESQKEIFLRVIKKNCGISKLNEIEQLISETFCNNEKNKFFESLERINSEVNGDDIDNFSNIKYKDVFDDKIKDFLNNDDIKENITKYIEKYDNLLEESTYFKKGIFSHSQAENIAKQLKKNGFFEAEHAVLFGGKKLSTEQELTNVINQEKNEILSNEELKRIFDMIDEKITKNANLVNFRDFLSDNHFIIAELGNLESFKAKLWKYYIGSNKDIFNNLLDEYLKSRDKIAEIVKSANNEKTEWLNTIKIFNERFIVPFKVTIGNSADVILKDSLPSKSFEFRDGDDRKNIRRDSLLEVLSQGEKRALYLLDIIFEIEARKKEEGKHLFIVDDIADSFDYKNKYAIIEYLRDVSKENNFYQIILSHNFDFHRTISSRLSMKRCNKLMVKKQKHGITFENEKYQNNPFLDWTKNLDKKYKLIACIPFVRNLAEYSGNTENYKNLTSFLHIKGDSPTLEILKNEFTQILSCDLSRFDQTGDFLEFLREAARSIESNEIELEHKITLAILIRLEAERFIIDKIEDSTFVKNINNNQTKELVDEYKKVYDSEVGVIEILDKVQLMTPESIHLNSFMYEPLLDMSGEYLIRLHGEISNLR